MDGRSLIPVSDLLENLSHIGHSPFRILRLARLAAARALGWDGGPDYASLMPAYCQWLASHAPDWQAAFPMFTRYGHDPFDYAGADLVLARRTA